MTSISQLLLPGANQVLIHGKKLLTDIKPEQFSRKPFQDGAVTLINHPAFQYGHLGLYPERIANLLGLATDRVKAPQGFRELFIKGSPCHDDKDGNIYPAMNIISEHFSNSHDVILDLLKDVPDDVYYKANNEEATKDRFDTLGSFVIYLLTAHANTHFGQVLAWRRCMGIKGV